MSMYSAAELGHITRSARAEGRRVRLKITGFCPFERSPIEGLEYGLVIRHCATAAEAARIEERITQLLEADDYRVEIAVEP